MCGMVAPQDGIGEGDRSQPMPAEPLGPITGTDWTVPIPEVTAGGGALPFANA